MFLPARKAGEFYGVGVRTLHRWRNAGKISTAKTPSGLTLYECIIFEDNIRKDFCYCCVKDESEKELLLRQESTLKDLYPNSVILKDIGEGKFRQNFIYLIDEAIKNHVSKVIVLSKDILFDNDSEFNLFQFFLSRCQTEIIIPQTKLGKEIEDKKKILSILSHLSDAVQK